MVLQSKLIKCQALSYCCSLSEPQCCNLQLRNFINPNVVGDSPHNHNNLVVLSIHILNQPRERKWRLVNFAHEQTFKNDCIQLASSPSDKKMVQLDEKLEIDIIGFGRSVLRLLAFTSCIRSISIVAAGVEAQLLGMPLRTLCLYLANSLIKYEIPYCNMVEPTMKTVGEKE